MNCPYCLSIATKQPRKKTSEAIERFAAQIVGASSTSALPPHSIM